VFREGQAKQVLDDLYFDFIALADKMQSKVVIAENVKGMIAGNAKWYAREVVRKFKKIGYNCQLFLLNAATMGVPQRRERVFFIALKTDRKLKMSFSESPIHFDDISEGVIDIFKPIVPCDRPYYEKTKPGHSIASVHPKGNRFNSIRLNARLVAPTIASGSALYHPTQARKLTDQELSHIGSFPEDYNYLNIQSQYLIGMSVPPVMMAQVAYQVYTQLIQET
jgi:DNA (cytosine-5)-methyltransferase 1